ncbi:enoyl-CoA hydratase/isomerase family protein [Frankia sp. Cas3]|uniref:enoyl-CoA hydratase/isomerase family protein n=1 Tax=Frankia sp. Cas3 TaxID=3073926 RepID=UPI002AD40B6D|nr:enoyl-CoA hydratase-related protein [Frankia sp. Cas3]
MGEDSGTGEPVTYQVVDGSTAVLTLSRADRLNALTYELMARMDGLLERAATDDAVRAVVITGAGRGFCACADRDMLAGLGRSGTVHADVVRIQRNMRTALLLREMPKVTIAAVNGACAGAGLSWAWAWACACDLRYADATAVFVTAFGAAGQSGDYGGTWTLPRIVGPGLARELYFTGVRVDAARALQIGLVEAVVPAGGVLAHALGVARQVAAAPPLAVEAMKANFRDGERLGFADHLAAEAERMAHNARTEDAAEANAARRAGRPAAYHRR